WLRIDQASGVTPAYPSVSVVATGLRPGTYTGAVIFSWSGGSETLPITFIMGQSIVVQGQCAVATATPALNFQGAVGKPNPAPQAALITTSSACVNTLTWKATAVGGTWLSVTPTTGTVGLKAASVTNVGVVLKGLAAGTYRGTVTIKAIDSVTKLAVGTPKTIAVTLTVQSGCTLQSPSVAKETFSTEVGTNPATQT